MRFDNHAGWSLRFPFWYWANNQSPYKFINPFIISKIEKNITSNTMTFERKQLKLSNISSHDRRRISGANLAAAAHYNSYISLKSQQRNGDYVRTQHSSEERMNIAYAGMKTSSIRRANFVVWTWGRSDTILLLSTRNSFWGALGIWCIWRHLSTLKCISQDSIRSNLLRRSSAKALMSSDWQIHFTSSANK